MAEAGWTRKKCVIYRWLEDVLLAGHRKKIMALRKTRHAMDVAVWVGQVILVQQVLILEQIKAWKAADIVML